MTFNRTIAVWGGAAFAVGNVLFLVNKLNEMSRVWLSRPMTDLISSETDILTGIGQVLLMAGYAAFWLFANAMPRFNKISLRVFAVGGVILAIGHVVFMELSPALEFMFALVILGLLLMLPALIAYGVNGLRQKAGGLWSWLTLFTGVMGFVGFFIFSGDDSRGVFLVFRTLFALGLVGMGLALMLSRPTSTKVNQ